MAYRALRPVLIGAVLELDAEPRRYLLERDLRLQFRKADHSRLLAMFCVHCIMKAELSSAARGARRYLRTCGRSIGWQVSQQAPRAVCDPQQHGHPANDGVSNMAYQAKTKAAPPKHEDAKGAMPDF